MSVHMILDHTLSPDKQAPLESCSKKFTVSWERGWPGFAPGIQSHLNLIALTSGKASLCLRLLIENLLGPYYVISSLLCKAPEICDEGFLPSRTEEGKRSNNYDLWRNARVLEISRWEAPKGERRFFLESRSIGQEGVGREGITSDLHAREGARGCGGTGKEGNSSTKSRTWLQKEHLVHSLEGSEPTWLWYKWKMQWLGCVQPTTTGSLSSRRIGKKPAK